jgi:CRISPR type I-E-associated protein CasB/Cse2
MTPDDEHIKKFVAFLEMQNGPSGRALLAELRRAAADPLNTYGTVWLMGDKLPDSDAWDFDAYRLVAALFALHATKLWGRDNRLQIPRFYKDETRRSFGASLRRLRNQLSVGQDSLDLRVKALIDTNREDLAEPLRGLLQRIATAERSVPIDYAQLLDDLIHWDDGDRVRRTWSSDYWSRRVPSLQAPSSSQPTNESTTA